MYSIRVTNKGRHQVLRDGKPVSNAGAFDTSDQAQAEIERLQQFDAEQQAERSDRAPHNTLYASIFSMTEMREMRNAIQNAYNEAAHTSKSASAHVRAAIRVDGAVSCVGRDISAVRMSRADNIATYADDLWTYHTKLCEDYEAALLAKMRELGCPLWMRRGPGRPIGSGQDRNVTKRLRLTIEEGAALDQLVSDSGLTFSQFARNRLLGQTLVQKCKQLTDSPNQETYERNFGRRFRYFIDGDVLYVDDGVVVRPSYREIGGSAVLCPDFSLD